MIEGDELYLVYGGATNILSTSSLNAISRMITTLLTLGRNIGSAIRYAVSGKSCS